MNFKFIILSLHPHRAVTTAKMNTMSPPKTDKCELCSAHVPTDELAALEPYLSKVCQKCIKKTQQSEENYKERRRNEMHRTGDTTLAMGDYLDEMASLCWRGTGGY
jgi:hypothetical protein